MADQPPVRDSLREVTDSSWLIGNKHLLSRSTNNTSTSWPDSEEGFYYNIIEAPQPPPESKLLSSSSGIPLVYDVGDAHAVWKIGKAYLKVKIVEVANETREQVTLEAVNRMGLSFKVPAVLFHDEFQGRHYMVVTEVPGKTIAETWPTMDESTRDKCVQRIADICVGLSARQSDPITGVDGNELAEYYLSKRKDFRPAVLRRFCEDVGMDCSTVHFYHTDMGPTNVLVETLADGSISLGIIDWEAAGFVPKEWIRTKFRCSGGMVLEYYDFEDERRGDWQRFIQRALEARGFPDCVYRWLEKNNES